MNNFIKKWIGSSLILKIMIGLFIGAILGIFFPKYDLIGIPGKLFVSALKAIAPLLVFVLVVSALSKSSGDIGGRFKIVIILYLFSTFLAAMVTVMGSYLFPTTIHLINTSTVSAQGNLIEVITNMFLSIFSNPLESLIKGNYLSILFWAIVLGISLRTVASKNTIMVIDDLSNAVSIVVGTIIQFAPIGIMGLVFSAVSKSGLGIFVEYGQLILVLVGCILCVALITNPLIVACIKM